MLIGIFSSYCFSAAFVIFLSFGVSAVDQVSESGEEKVTEFRCVTLNITNSSDPYYDSLIMNDNVVTQTHMAISTCEAPGEGKRSHCYAFWSNLTVPGSQLGGPRVLKGCWLDSIDCYNRNECIAHYQAGAGYYCCCDTYMCNAKVTLSSEPLQYKIPSRPTTNSFNEVWGPSTTRVILTSLLPLVSIALLIIMVFSIWRLCKSRFRGDSSSSTGSIESKDGPLLPIRSSPTPSLDIVTALKNIQLLEVLATRHFGGCVKKARLDNEVVAVKIFRSQEKESWEKEKDLYTLTSMKQGHPNVLRFISAMKHEVVEKGSESFEYWLITEYQEQGNLHDFLKSRTICWNDAVRIIMSLCKGLVFLHSRNFGEVLDCNMTGKKLPIAHRDIKSRNILLKGNLTPCIADFGLALVLTGNIGTTHSQVGTRRYMSPEVLDGSIDFKDESFLRIDIYAFALVLWEILSRTYATGVCASSDYKQPFQDRVGLNPSLEDMQQAVVEDHLRPELKKEWTDHEGLNYIQIVIDEMWDKDADARPSANSIYQRLTPLIKNGSMDRLFSMDVSLSQCKDGKDVCLESNGLISVVDNMKHEDDLRARLTNNFTDGAGCHNAETAPDAQLPHTDSDDYILPSFNIKNQIHNSNYPYASIPSPIANGYLPNSPSKLASMEKPYESQICSSYNKNTYNEYYPPNVTPVMDISQDGKNFNSQCQFHFTNSCEMTPLIGSAPTTASNSTDGEGIAFVNRSGHTSHISPTAS